MAAPSPGAVPTAATPWWRRWSEPIVVVTVIVSLVAALAAGAVAEFSSVKADVHASEARIHEDIRTSEARLHEEIQASEARVNKRIDEVAIEIRTVNDKLDRLLETLLATKS